MSILKINTIQVVGKLAEIERKFQEIKKRKINKLKKKTKEYTEISESIRDLFSEIEKCYVLDFSHPEPIWVVYGFIIFSSIDESKLTQEEANSFSIFFYFLKDGRALIEPLERKKNKILSRNIKGSWNKILKKMKNLSLEYFEEKITKKCNIYNMTTK